MNPFLELLVSNVGRALIVSFKQAPRDWQACEFHLKNARTGASFWIANGILGFKFETPGYLGIMEKFIVYYYVKKMLNRKVEDSLTGVDKFEI